MTLYLRFPEFQLPSRRFIRIEVFTQDVSNGIGACYNDPGDMIEADSNPWLRGGIPVPITEAAPDAGMIGIDGISFQIAGIAVYDGRSLHALVTSTRSDETAWNIRVYTRASAGTYSGRPDFWGIIDASEIDGDVMSWTDDSYNRYQLVARNRLALLERVNVSDWITGFFPYNTPGYEIAPSKVMIDGYELAGVFYQIPGSTEWRAWPTSYVRFVSLKALLRSVSEAIGVSNPVNFYDLIRSTWIFHATDGAGNPTTHTADDLAIVSGMRTPSDWYWHFTFFDWETRSGISFFNNGDLLQVLKQVLVPLGLQAAVETHSRSGESYLEIRELELASGIKARSTLRGATFSPGENAARGFRVVVEASGEIAINGTGDQSIDCCYMSATRLRAGERWTHETGGVPNRFTDDIPCLFGSLYVYDSANNVISNVTGITVKSDGRDGVLVTPPDVTTLLGGNGIGEAAARYYFNPQPPSVSHVGIFRPVMERVEFRAYDFRDEVTGTATGTAAGKVVVAGKFTEHEDVYLHRRVLNDDTGAEAYVTGKDSVDQLSLSADIFASGDLLVIQRPRVGEFAELPNGDRYVIRSLGLNAREGTIDYACETETSEA